MRVIYGDTDQMGVVYYANYLRYFELARTEFFLALGGDYRSLESQGFALPVTEAVVRYKQPARFQDELAIEVWIVELRRVSLRFEYAVRRGPEDELLCEGHTIHACVGKNGKLVSIPPELHKLAQEQP